MSFTTDVSRPSRSRLALFTVLALALALRAVPAARHSLWLDELHTLHHATRPTLGALLESVRSDNHPPLSFVAARASRAVLGESELALRLPSVLAGVVGVWIAARIARRSAASGGSAPVDPQGASLCGALGPWLACCAALHVAVAAEARMYAWLALAVLACVDGALAVRAVRAGRGGRAAIAAGVAIGLLAHYHFLHALVVLVPAAVAVLPRGRRLAAAGPAALGAALGAAPWYAWAFARQLARDLPPGGTESGLRKLAEGFAHLCFHGASLAGPARPLYVAGGALALALAVLGLVRALRAGGEVRAAGVLLGATAFALPAWAALVAAWMPRAGFNWAYLAASALPFALLVAAAAGPGPLRRTRGALVGIVLALAASIGVLFALGPPREDHRAAAAFVLAQAGPDDVVLAADRQPELFPHGIGWSYYARGAARAPRTLAVGPGYAIVAPAALDAAPRAFVIGRSLPHDASVLVELRARFPRERVERFGEAIFVHVFER